MWIFFKANLNLAGIHIPGGHKERDSYQYTEINNDNFALKIITIYCRCSKSLVQIEAISKHDVLKGFIINEDLALKVTNQITIILN